MPKKAAVLVNGIYNVNLRREGLKESVEAIKEQFYDYDIFYQCWDTRLNRHIFKDIDEEILWIPSPEKNERDPYDLVLETGIPIPGRNPSKESIFKLNKRHNKLVRTRCFQLYGFCLLYKHIKEKYNYDYIFRTRWDIVFSDYFSADYLLHLAKSNVLGCGVAVSTESFMNYYRSKIKEGMRKKEIQTNKRKVMRELLNSEIGILSETKWSKRYESDHHKNLLIDFMMTIHKDDFDVDNSIKLFHENKMYPAEWGWWQIFCQKRKHINIDGFVSIRKNMEHIGYKMYWKYK